MDFETFAEKWERKYFCSFTAAAIAVGAAVAGSVVSSALSGGGSGGSTGGGSGPSAYNPGSVNTAAQPVPIQTSSTAAPGSYNPQQQAQAWTSIFSDFAKPTANPDTISLPVATNAAPTPTIQAGS